MSDLLVPRRFRGPASSGNGGWTAGALAGLVEREPASTRPGSWPAIEVSLRRPPPLDTAMAVTLAEGSAVAAIGGTVVAEARTADSPSGPVDPVPAARARAAEASYAGLRAHPFAACFVCGPDRAEGDGLRIFPGRVDDDLVAATWTPHPSTSDDHAEDDPDDVRRSSLAVTWAALDCTGGWSADLEERPMVLGRMTARVDTLPVVGEEHVVVGHLRGEVGRKTFTATTLYDADGRIVACAEHIWITIDPKDFA